MLDEKMEGEEEVEVQPITPFLGPAKSESEVSEINETVMMKALHQTEAPKKIEVLEKEEDWASEDDGLSKKQAETVVEEVSQKVEIVLEPSIQNLPIEAIVNT